MVKFQLFTFNIILLASFVAASVPSYLPVCGRRNPNLDECVRQSAMAVRPKLREGIPELGVPPVEPLLIPHGLPLANSQDLNATAYNVKLWNIPEYESKSLHIDLKAMTIDFNIYFKVMKLQGDYDVSTKIIVPIHAKGPVEIDAQDIDAKVLLRYRLVDTKKGKQLYFTSMTIKLKIGDYKSKFVPREGPEATFADAINSVLNTNRREIIEQMIPGLEKVISSEMLNRANSICSHFTYDELFPDHE